MTELCRYPITNTGLKNDLIIMVFYGNLTGVRKKGGHMKKLKLVGMLAAVVMLMFIVVILNENEEIIEYLVYDRLSENEKCELYVLYRSKKNTDGSWYISEAEILDIFAYSMSTKDVVSSGKTSWSATGSEEHEIN